MFRIYEGDTYLFSPLIVFPDDLLGDLLGTFSLSTPPNPEDQAHLQRVILRYAVRYAEERLADGSWPPEELTDPTSYRETIDGSQLPLLRSIFKEKTCRFQLTDNGDLYCSAAAQSDETVRGSRGLSFLAATSKPVCRACNLPDTDYICTALAHPEIFGILITGPTVRQVGGAMCQKGRAEIEDPSLCRPHGHECWERGFEGTAALSPEVRSPFSLPEALDFLNTAWRLLFGRERPLLRLRSAESVARIAASCSSRSDFEAGMTALADIFKLFDIGDDLLPAGLSIPADQTLSRLAAVLASRLPAEELGPVTAAVRVLRKANSIRVSLQHTAASSDLPRDLGELGVSYPPPSWGEAWEVVRQRVTQALDALRQRVLSLL
jgi:hypothetical protein